MSAPDVNSELAVSVTLLPLMRSMMRTTLEAMAMTASDPISEIATGRSHLTRRAG
jgi:hypothetical protein